MSQAWVKPSVRFSLLAFCLVALWWVDRLDWRFLKAGARKTSELPHAENHLPLTVKNAASKTSSYSFAAASRRGDTVKAWLRLLKEDHDTQLRFPFDGRSVPKDYTGCAAMKTVCSEAAGNEVETCHGVRENLMDTFNATAYQGGSHT